MEYKVKITKTEYFEPEGTTSGLSKDYKGKALVRVRAIVGTDIGRYQFVRWFAAEAPERMGEWREKNPGKCYNDLLKRRKEVREREIGKAKDIMKSVIEGIEPPYRTNTKTTEEYFSEITNAVETDKYGVVVGTKVA
jgi:hypothetical protein